MPTAGLGAITALTATSVSTRSLATSPGHTPICTVSICVTSPAWTLNTAEESLSPSVQFTSPAELRLPESAWPVSTSSPLESRRTTPNTDCKPGMNPWYVTRKVSLGVNPGVTCTAAARLAAFEMGWPFESARPSVAPVVPAGIVEVAEVTRVRCEASTSTEVSLGISNRPRSMT